VHLLAVALYIAQHLLSVLLLNKNTRPVFALIGLVIFLAIVVIKEDAYDLIVYAEAIDSNSYGYFELMFAGLIGSLANFTTNSSYVLILIQAILSAMIMLTGLFFRQNFIICALIAALSVFLLMASNNALRQGFSTAFLIYAMIFVLRKHYILSLVCVVAAFYFHKSAVLFASTFYFIAVIDQFFYRSRLAYMRSWVVSSMGVLLAFGFSLLLGYTSYGHYYQMDFSSESDRVVLYLKIILIAFLMILVDYVILRKPVGRELRYFKTLRLFIVSLLVGMSGIGSFDEIGSRILFFYFGVELLYMMYLVNVNRYLPVVIILLSYTFAFNVWNVLGGLPRLS
jgi:hypothetical protein